MTTPRLLTKRGYEVRLSGGQSRGVYRHKSTAEFIATMATVVEFMYFDPITIQQVRIPFWRRFGTKATS